MLYPSYLNLYETGELAERAAAAWEILRSCTICPQNCRCNRIAGKTGVCHSGTEAIVASWTVHRREEDQIKGNRVRWKTQCGYCKDRITWSKIGDGSDSYLDIMSSLKRYERYDTQTHAC